MRVRIYVCRNGHVVYAPDVSAPIGAPCCMDCELHPSFVGTTEVDSLPSPPPGTKPTITGPADIRADTKSYLILVTALREIAAQQEEEPEHDPRAAYDSVWSEEEGRADGWYEAGKIARKALDEAGVQGG